MKAIWKKTVFLSTAFLAGNLLLSGCIRNDGRKGYQYSLLLLAFWNWDRSVINVGEISGATSESGGTATYSLVLGNKPLSDVEISIDSSDSTEGVISPSTITFTESNWDTPQIITVTGVDDTIVDGDQYYGAINSPAVSGDSGFDGLDPDDVIVLNTDDENTEPWSPPSVGGCGVLPYRRKIIFGTSHDALSSGYTAAFTMDTTLATGNVQRADGNDVRIMWQPTGSSPVELDRLGDNWNTGSTTIRFRLQSAISANLNEDADGSYFVYYGCATAGNPPQNEMNIYYFADFFDRADSSVIGNGWSMWDLEGGQVIDILNQKLRIMPTTVTGNSVGAKQFFALGDIPGNFIVEFDWDIWADATTDGGETAWIFWGMNLGNSSLMTNGDRTTGVAVGLYSCEDTLGTICVSGTSNNLMSKSSGSGTFLIENSLTGPHSFKLEVNKSAMNYDYSRDGGGTANRSFTYGTTVIDQIRIAADNYGSGGYHYIDNIRIYLNPTNPPATAAGSEESNS